MRQAVTGGSMQCKIHTLFQFCMNFIHIKNIECTLISLPVLSFKSEVRYALYRTSL